MNDRRQAQFGVHVGQQNASMDQLIALWRRLDTAVDWISIWDHLYEAPPDGGLTPHYEAVASLGALASVTQSARIGCLMFCVPFRNPAVLAKSCVAIDHIANGRFEPGFGAGWHEPEFKAHGIDFPHIGARFEMLTEGLEIITAMLNREEATTFSGSHFHVEDVTCVPGPVKGTLPLWAGGRGPNRTPAIAARYADGWNVPYVGPNEFRRLNHRIDEACELVDRNPATLERSINLAFHMGADEVSAAAERRKISEHWGPEMAERITAGALTGTPDQAIEQLAGFRAAGADLINIALRFPVDNEALEMYLDQVIPEARKALN
jgi:alkanesulfonate monooxygenase SsuD/methylene tetrahydromethanopterin reductase-like flavin-dependent oxidoreductase (luciferase family)